MRRAFTLAEVLITLGVIGVIAAITLPTLINNYQKMQTVNKLKADYTLVYNALKRAEADYGDMKNWQMEETPEEFANKYLKPYLKIIEEYDNDRMIIKRLNGKDLNVGKAYKHYVLSNGISLTLAYCPTCVPVRMSILIDINGFKEPNRIGFDDFGFAYTNERGFAPACAVIPDREGYKTAAAKTDRCVVGGGGNCCSALIIVDGWKIADDYPWKNK